MAEGGVLRMPNSPLWPWGQNTNKIELKRSVSLQKKDETFHPYTRIAFVWNTVWMIDHDKGTVYQYNTKGDFLSELQLNKDIKKPRTVIALDSKVGIIAASSGLYVINNEGELRKRIISGDFSDVCLVGNIVYALEYQHGKVIRFNVQLGDLQKKDEIMLNNYSNENKCSGQHYTNTFKVVDDKIYVAMCYSQRIVHYDIGGRKRGVLRQEDN